MVFRLFALALALFCIQLLAIQPPLLDLVDCADRVIVRARFYPDIYSGINIILKQEKEGAESHVLATKSIFRNQWGQERVERSKNVLMPEDSDLEDVWSLMTSPDDTTHAEDLPPTPHDPQIFLTFQGWRRFPNHTLPHVTEIKIDECDRILYYPYQLPFPDLEGVNFNFKGFLWPLLKTPQYQNIDLAYSIVEAPRGNVKGYHKTGNIFLHDYGTYKHHTFYKDIPRALMSGYPKTYLGTPDRPFEAQVSLNGLVTYPQYGEKVDLCEDNTIAASSLSLALPGWCEKNLCYYHNLFVAKPHEDKADPEHVPLAVCLMALPDHLKVTLFNFLQPSDALSLVQAIPALLPYVKYGAGTWGGKVSPLPNITIRFCDKNRGMLLAILQEVKASSGSIPSEWTLDHIAADPVLGRDVYQTVRVTSIIAPTASAPGGSADPQSDVEPDVEKFLMDLEWRFTKDGPPFFLLGPAIIEDNASKGVTITRTIQKPASPRAN